MKKTLQKFNIKVAGNSSIVLTEALKQDYAKTTGVFLTPKDNTNFQDILITLKVEGIEILPLETDATIIAFSGNYPLNDAIWNFKQENIPARSASMEFTASNTSTKVQSFTLYLVLENE